MRQRPFDQKTRPTIVALGGTGVIGRALAAASVEADFDYFSLSLSPTAIDAKEMNVCLDLTIASADTIEEIFDKLARDVEILAIVDIIGVRGAAAEAVSKFSTKKGVPLAIISSCLLYEHDGSAPVGEDARSLGSFTQNQSYQRQKLDIEKFWQERDLPWRILRTHHVLGRGALLGCIPAHNRDPNLLRLLTAGQPLNLARRGDVLVSYVHPQDLVETVLELFASRLLENKIINIVHPVPVKALDYYGMVARELGTNLAEPLDWPVNDADFWASTARNNVFCSRYQLVRERPFRHDIQSCIKSVLSVGEKAYPELGQFLRARISGKGNAPF